MKGKKCQFTITGPPVITEHFLRVLRENPPKDEHGQSPKWAANHSATQLEPIWVKWDEPLYPEITEATLTVELTYPDPGPDIPALIKAWHAEPSRKNRAPLWTALRCWLQAPFFHGDTKYAALDDGTISVG